MAEQGQHGEQASDAQPDDGRTPRADVERRPAGQPDQSQSGESQPAESHTQQPQPEQPPQLDAEQPPQLDAEQLRQFEQFQQFQQFQRFQELQRHAGEEPLPAAAPRRRRRAPWWLRWLGRKLLAWLIFFVLTAIALTWAANYFLGSDEEQQPPPAKTGGGKYHTNTILPTNPNETVRTLYDEIAKGADPRLACGLFNDSARRSFVTDLGYQDCGQAIRDLHSRVEHATNYAESIDTNTRQPPTTEHLRISSCEFEISGGPALGTFTVSRVERGQWLITGHRDGPTQCPAPSTR